MIAVSVDREPDCPVELELGAAVSVERELDWPDGCALDPVLEDELDRLEEGEPELGLDVAAVADPEPPVDPVDDPDRLPVVAESALPDGGVVVCPVEADDPLEPPVVECWDAGAAVVDCELGDGLAVPSLAEGDAPEATEVLFASVGAVCRG